MVSLLWTHVLYLFSLIKIRTKSTLYFPAASSDWSTTNWLLFTILRNVPCVLWPCLTQVANDCWKFLFCWNVTGVPILVDSTTLVLGVPWPESEPTMTLGVAAGVAGVPVGVAVTEPGFCSRRFWDGKSVRTLTYEPVTRRLSMCKSK